MNEFEAFLQNSLDDLPDSPVKEAMLYSLMAGGKRIRPRLLFEALRDYGIDPDTGLDAAAALEMVHTYSLIHDDLPAMDNDSLRRGRPSAHVAFGESTAILAGDALLSEAFLLLSKKNRPENLELIRELALAAGAAGMVLGQELDLNDPSELIDDLVTMEINKTGRLIAYPLVAAAILADRKEDIPALRALGLELGLAFQIQDDLFDLQGDEQKMGKSLSDTEHGKETLAVRLGKEEAEAFLVRLFDSMNEKLNEISVSPINLRGLIQELKDRNY